MRIAGKSPDSFRYICTRMVLKRPHQHHIGSTQQLGRTPAPPVPLPVSAGRSLAWARSNWQWVGYFTYKCLASTGGKMAGFKLAISSWQEKFHPREDLPGSKSEARVLSTAATLACLRSSVPKESNEAIAIRFSSIGLGAGPGSYSLFSYVLYKYGLCNYGLYSYDQYSYGL